MPLLILESSSQFKYSSSILFNDMFLNDVFYGSVRGQSGWQRALLHKVILSKNLGGLINHEIHDCIEPFILTSVFYETHHLNMLTGSATPNLHRDKIVIPFAAVHSINQNVPRKIMCCLQCFISHSLMSDLP
jgi:hypothetical protein